MSDCIPCGCRDSLPTKELGIEDWKDEYLKLAIYASAVSSENKKLRELMRIMHSEMVSCEDNGYICGGHKFDKRVRELGVEVDG